MTLWQRQMASHIETGYIYAFPKIGQGSSLKGLDHSMPNLPWPVAEF